MTEASQRHRNILIYLGLALATAAVYWPVCHYPFVSFDDSTYIYENPHLRGGLTVRGLGWALTTPLDQWMPVTWLVRMLECQFFGLNVGSAWSGAGAHHLVNVFFHLVNVLLLFGVLDRLTGARWRSALVAALFALHPLHVESVAWVTGLKDVLSMFFGILTIWAYVRYVEQFTVRGSQFAVGGSGLDAVRSSLPASRFPLCSFALTLCFFALALMSKPMMVTLPFVLLLLDYWPLGRAQWTEPAIGACAKRSPSQLFKEKIPFFALAMASCVATWWAQRATGAMTSLEKLPTDLRVANALLSYTGYIGKAFWPTGLAVFYPLDANLSRAAAMVAGIGLAGVTAAVILRARREAWLVTGWFWYLGTLVPVIGLVQVGGQSMADRYAYIPLIGLFLMVCWSVPSGMVGERTSKTIVCMAGVAALTVCAVLTRIQLGYWKDSETLFRHALNVTRNNWLAHNNLGMTLARTGRVPEAMEHYVQALSIWPDYAEARFNLGLADYRLGRFSEAMRRWEQTLQVRPGYAEAYYNLGVVLEQTGRWQEALAHYEQALRFKPDFTDAQNGLARLRAAR